MIRDFLPYNKSAGLLPHNISMLMLLLLGQCNGNSDDFVRNGIFIIMPEASEMPCHSQKKSYGWTPAVKKGCVSRKKKGVPKERDAGL